MTRVLLDTSKLIPNEESRVRELEKMVGARLPEDYRHYLLHANNARPYIEGYDGYYLLVRVRWPEGSPASEENDTQLINVPEILVENWRDPSPEATRDIRRTLTNAVFWPKDNHWIPIWNDPGGNYFLLGVRKHNYGKVFYLDRGYIEFDSDGNYVNDDPIAFVANSFTEFIQMIEQAPDDWDLWEAAGKPRLPLSTEELEALVRAAKPPEKPHQTNFSAEKIRASRKENSDEKSTGE